MKISNFPIDENIPYEHVSFFETIKTSNKPLLGLGFLLLFLSFLSIFAFTNPDGLESAGLQLFPSVASSYFELGIANDYDFLGLGPVLGTILSAFLGILIILSFYFIPASFINGRKKTVET